MTLSSIAALFGAMVILAAIPSPSVFAVVARSISSGFSRGLVMVLGIVFGDFIFILLAIGGLAAIAETMGGLFVLIKYLGSAYLIGLGIQLWRSQPQAIEVQKIKESSWFSSFLSGLLITLSDQKAILFYIGFFPAFLDLSSVSIVEIGIVMAIATIAIGGVKLGYAYLADRARFLFQSSKAKKRMNAIAASVMIVTGIFLVTKT